MTIAPNGSANMSVQTSTGVIAQGPGADIKVTEAATSSPQQTQAPAAGQSSSNAKGDINGDGKINSLDVLKLQRYLLNLETISEKGKLAADLNGDGKVNSQDLLLLQKKILGL
uniref:dockerin type I repeat-containing protein n=1 Tax=Clostridium sp. NkU-1 TaxID=1095009 RepID=UPI000A73EBA1